MSNIFDQIADGTFFGSEEEVTMEAVNVNSLENMKMVQRQVTLPEGSPIGRGNVAFLYTHNEYESIEIINSKVNCLAKKHYKFYYFNMMYQGRIYNKKFRYRLMEDRKALYDRIEKETMLLPKLKLTAIGNDNRNMYYDLFKYIEIFTSICKKLQPARYIDLYWDFMKKIFMINIPGYNNRFVLVNLENYKLTKGIKDNLENPLYLLYYTLYRNPSLVSDVNMDFIFYNGKKIMRINPSLCNEKSYIKLRVEMNKIMRGITESSIVDDVTDEKTIKKDEIVSNVTADITSVTDTEEELHTNEQLVAMKKVTPVEKEVEQKVQQKVDRAAEIIKDAPVDDEKVTEIVSKNVKKEIEDDHEMIKKLYYQNKKGSEPAKSAASSARDEQLRKEQKNIKIGNMTLEQISKVNSEKVEIPVTDISKSVETTNENMKEVRFDNVNKTYIDKVMKKDIVNAITALNDKSIPMFIRDIKVEDTSDELNYKETYTIFLEDGNRKRHTVKVDIPKFIDDKFLYIGGNKKVIKHQSFYLPIVKIAPNKVEIVTNYSKMTIERVENASDSSIERMRKIILSDEEVKPLFHVGSAYPNNKNFITTLEYDDYSKMYDMFKMGRSIIYFDQNVAMDYAKTNKIEIPEKMMFIGKVKGENIFIDTDKQTTSDGRTITDLILDCLPEEVVKKYYGTKSPKRLRYVKVKIMGRFMSVGMLLGLWEGLSSLLKKMKVEYRIEDKVGELGPNEEFIKFEDCVLIYKQDTAVSLIMNGFRMFNTAAYPIADFDEKEPYVDYIAKIFGKVIIENALMNFYEFVIDPITKEILESMDLPTKIVDIYIYAAKLLSDSQYTLGINQNLSRIRSAEIIPAILYERLSKNYVNYRNSNGRKKFTVPQNCVIKEILAQKTVEDYSTLNPTLEMEMLHSVSTKGFRGVNLDDSYTIEKRGYDNSMIGIIAPNTSPDGSVGISRTLTLEPEVTNVRGIIEDKHEKLDELKDTNLFSPGELTIPLAATIDDPNRLG